MNHPLVITIVASIVVYIIFSIVKIILQDAPPEVPEEQPPARPATWTYSDSAEHQVLVVMINSEYGHILTRRIRLPRFYEDVELDNPGLWPRAEQEAETLGEVRSIALSVVPSTTKTIPW